MKIEKCFPNFVKKSLTFTIDDGNIKWDKVFLDILNPYGFVGTFNLVSSNMRYFSLNEGSYPDFYKGHEVANHCKYHPFLIKEGIAERIADTFYDRETADPEYLYRDKENPSLIWFPMNKNDKNSWRQCVTYEDYLRYVKEGKDEIEKIFGEGSVKGFIYPYGWQRNEELDKDIEKMGYQSIRRTGERLDLDNFAIPKNRMAWSYNATCTSLLTLAEKYDALPDDGELKFFAFGVHSVDFEREQRWDDLKEYAQKYGNRKDDFWYASVGDIMTYEDKINSLIVEDNKITNPTDTPLYVKVDGEKIVLEPNTSYAV